MYDLCPIHVQREVTPGKLIQEDYKDFLDVKDLNNILW